MTRFFLISLGAHVVALTLLLLFGFTDAPEPLVVDSVRLRLGRFSRRVGVVEAAQSGTPREARREFREAPSVPQARGEGSEPGRDWIPEKAVITENPRIVSSGLPSAVAPLPDFTVTDPDPLSGLGTDGEWNDVKTVTDEWAFSWENGGIRDTLYVPKIDRNVIETGAERLIDLVIGIEVAPDGSVVTAEILPPGTGDITIDRYMNGLALSFVFTPRPPGEGSQTGTLRLVFRDSGSGSGSGTGGA